MSKNNALATSIPHPSPLPINVYCVLGLNTYALPHALNQVSKFELSNCTPPQHVINTVL